MTLPVNPLPAGTPIAISKELSGEIGLYLGMCNNPVAFSGSDRKEQAALIVERLLEEVRKNDD